MKPKSNFFLFFFILLLISGILFWHQKSNSNTQITVGGSLVKVEIMDTDAKKEKGLSDRQYLCEDCGLLFVYDEPGLYTFWMKRMHFDIDIIWIQENKVVDITYGAKKPSSAEFEAPSALYRPAVPADQVLEVNAGFVEKRGINIGDEVK